MAKPYPIDPFPADIDRDAFGHWLSGFTDGEGCFNLRKQRWSQGRCWVRNASFQIGLRADDVAILRQIRSFWGCGKVNFHKARVPSDRNPRDCDSFQYTLAAAEPLHTVIVPHFLKYPLRAKKARDFAIWRRGVELVWTIVRRGSRGPYARWTQQDRERFDELKAALEAVRIYSYNGGAPDAPGVGAAGDTDCPLFDGLHD